MAAASPFGPAPTTHAFRFIATYLKEASSHIWRSATNDLFPNSADLPSVPAVECLLTFRTAPILVPEVEFKGGSRNREYDGADAIHCGTPLQSSPGNC